MTEAHRRLLGEDSGVTVEGENDAGMRVGDVKASVKRLKEESMSVSKAEGGLGA